MKGYNLSWCHPFTDRPVSTRSVQVPNIFRICSLISFLEQFANGTSSRSESWVPWPPNPSLAQSATSGQSREDALRAQLKVHSDAALEQRCAWWEET